MTNKKTAISYEDIPYESHPFSYNRPENLRTIGVLFGMNPPQIETARILELGCASGGNIVNFAESYPKSSVIGIDLSKAEITHGQKIIKDLGLKNLELKNLSITDLDESLGKFDYIICHGILSWVPEIVQKAIFNVFKTLLNPNGIAFVSYNTLPGWNMVNNIRDMMLFHSALFENAYDKLNQGKLFLNFVNEALENSTLPYAKFLKQQTNFLINQPDYYLIHEYLGEENTQFYFHQVMKSAAEKDLAYLGDANINSMFIGNLPTKAAEKLQTVNDIVRTEQYMDFITNRQFRNTLLCHKDVKLTRNISSEKLNEFYTTFHIVPEKPAKEVDLNNAFENINFYYQGLKDNSINSSSPIMKAILYSYSENINNPLKTDKLLAIAHKKLPKTDIKDFKAEFDASIGRLVFGGYVKLFSDKPKYVYEVSDKPKVSDLVRYQVSSAGKPNFWVTNRINEVVSLQQHEKYVLELLDGKHDLEQIRKKLSEKLVSGELKANQEGKQVTDKKELEKLAEQFVDTALQKFKLNYLLVG